ncbi:MAG: xanthine dehydrogenase family protein molybdopterin-binding subunit [Chloroflexota bacterium]
MNKKTFQTIGTSVRKVDGVGKVTGQLSYAGDIVLPRMLHCKLLRSTHPHARIAHINTEQASQQKGIYAVLTGQELPKRYGILSTSEDETALALGKVRFVGDPIVAIAATDEEAAEAALRLVDVAYQPLHPIMTMDEATHPPKDEPIHEQSEHENIHKRIGMHFGDTAQGFAEADVVQEDIFFYEGNTHLAMEEHATVAHYTPDGQLTLWTSSQTPHYLHRALASYFEMPASRIRVIAPPNGGGFGGKSEPFNHEFIVAKLAMMTGRPVKIVLTREEVFYLHRGRHPVLMRIKTGVKQDGAITAVDFESILDGGSYGSYGIVTTHYTGALQTLSYDMPTYKFQSTRLFTNKPPSGPKRGHGTPQPRFALEVQLDKIAKKLDINPFDIRRNHLMQPYTQTANHLHVTTTGLGECLDALEKQTQFRTRYGKLPEGKGLGLATGAYITGASLPIYPNKMPQSGVQLLVDRSGSVTVFCGSTDIGQGSDSVLAMIVAEEFGVQVEDIRVMSSDTGITPVDLGSFASRVTLMTGQATMMATTKIKRLLFETAAKIFKVPAESFVAHNGFVYCEDEERRRIKFVDLVKLAEAQHGTLAATGSYTPTHRGGSYRGAALGPSPTYSYSACVAAVDVDPETAELRVEKIWMTHDIGKALNPTLVEGQVEGCIYMALGEALMEAHPFRRGLHKMPSMLDYKSPTFLEMPEIETILIETHDPAGPYGAKEVGQGPLLPVIPAITNAVYDAVGVWIDETPITPEKIFKALRLKSVGKEPRIGPTRLPSVSYPDVVEVPSHWGTPVHAA